MTAPAEWETKQACRNYPPGPWDLDAAKPDQRYARNICDACPVKAFCDQRARNLWKSGEHVQGIYAGLVWDTNPAKGKARNRKFGKTIEDYHRNRKEGAGEDAQPQQIVVTPVLTEPIEKQCAAPDCDQQFSVPPTGMAQYKEVCSSRCQKRLYRATVGQ